MSNFQKISVRIVSDIVWPWCWVGKRHLDQALELTGLGPNVSLEWLPFFLNSSLPADGVNLKQYMAEKYGPSVLEKFGGPNSPLTQAASRCGINFNSDRKMYPTIKAHALLEWSRKTENGGSIDHMNALMEVMFKRYFSSAENINSDEVLLASVAEVKGLNTEAARLLLQGTGDSSKKSKASQPSLESLQQHVIRQYGTVKSSFGVRLVVYLCFSYTPPLPWLRLTLLFLHYH